MKKFLSLIFVLSTISQAFACPQDIFEEIASQQKPAPSDQPEEDVVYIQEEEFNRVLNEIQAIYQAYLAPAGITFEANGFWNDRRKNGTVRRVDSTWRILVYGGYARSPYVTTDVIARTACHEVGHHLGGTHFYSGTYSWASGEGQSDYYTTLKCLRKYFENKDNQEYLRDKEIPAIVVSSCNEVWGEETNESFICQRSTIAGLDWAAVQSNRRGRYDLATPDISTASQTSHRHPRRQCRLDTMFQGALCNVDHTQTTDSDDSAGGYMQGTCTRFNGDTIGLRPRCWFNPADFL